MKNRTIISPLVPRRTIRPLLYLQPNLSFLTHSQEKVVKKKAKKTISKLSFAHDDEEQEEQPSEASLGKRAERNSEEGQDGDTENAPAPLSKKSKFGKDPNIDTSFLPDREREEEERRVREELRQEWLRKQEEIKKETIQITYSYWDGSGHRKEVEVRNQALTEIGYFFMSFCSYAK